MTAKRITADALQELAWDHLACCKAPIEYDGPDAYLVLTEKHGGRFVATVEDVETCS